MILTLFGTETDYETMEKHMAYLGKNAATLMEQINAISSAGKGNKLGAIKALLFDSQAKIDAKSSLESDVKALDEFFRLMKEKNRSAGEAFNETMKDMSLTCQNFAKRTDIASKSSKDFADSQTLLASVSLKAGNVLKILGAAAAQMVTSFAVAVIATAVINTIMDIATAADQAAEHLGDLRSSYDQNMSDLDELNEKLNANKDAMDALAKTDTGEYVKQDEYDKLAATNSLLEAQVKLKENLAKADAADTNEWAYNMLTGNNEGNGWKQAAAEWFGTNIYQTHDKTSDSHYIDYMEDDPVVAIQKEKQYLDDLNKSLKQNAADFKNGKIEQSQYTYVMGDLNRKIDDAKTNIQKIGETTESTFESMVDDGSEKYKKAAGIFKIVAGVIDQVFGDAGTAAEETGAKITDTTGDAVATQEELMKQLATDIAAATTEYEKLNQTLNAQKDGVGIGKEEYDALIAANKEYAGCLEYNNGVMQINAEKAREIAKADTALKIAEYQLKDAQDKAKWKENSEKIAQCKKTIDDIAASKKNYNKLLNSDADETFRNSLENNVSALQAENDQIAKNCDQYQILISTLRQMSGEYQSWLDMQNASTGGDMLTDAKAAYDYIKEVNQDTESKDFMANGITNMKYRAAVDFVLPDTIDPTDQKAINQYLSQIAKYMDKEGTIQADNVVKTLANAGIWDPEQLKQGLYQVAEGIDFKDFAEALGTNDDVTTALIDYLNRYDFGIMIHDDAQSLEELVNVGQAASKELKGVADYSNLSIKVDVTDLKTSDKKIGALNNTIREMNEIKAKPDVDVGTVTSANAVIAACVAQIQALEAPVVMRVDTSQLSGNMQDAIDELQQFQNDYNNWQMKIQVGASEEDIAVAKKQVENSLESLQGIDIPAGLEINQESIETVESSLKKLTSEKLVELGVDAKAIDGYEPDSKTADVTYNVVRTEVDDFAKENHNLDANLVYHIKTEDTASSYAAASGAESQQGSHGFGAANGLGEPIGGKMLVGELGNEILCEPDGKWRTVGDNGAEFVNVSKGSIIFDHEKTQELLSRGWVNGRGETRANGTKGESRAPGSVSSSVVAWNPSAAIANAKSYAKAVDDTKKKAEEAKKAAEALRKEYERAKEVLDREKDALDEIKESLEEQKGVLDGIVDTVTDRIDQEIDRLEHMWDGLKDSFDNHKSELDGALSAVQKILDDKIKEYEKAQTALDDSYKPRLEALQEEIDRLNDKNDAEKEAIDLQKKKAALDAAKSAKTVRVYREGQGYVWEADQNAINDAQDAYNDALQQKQVSDLEKQKEALEKQLEDEKQIGQIGQIIMVVRFLETT